MTLVEICCFVRDTGSSEHTVSRLRERCNTSEAGNTLSTAFSAGYIACRSASENVDLTPAGVAFLAEQRYRGAAS